MKKHLLLSLFGSIIFYFIVKGILPKYCNNTVNQAIYVGTVLAIGLVIDELGSFTIQELKRHYLSLLRKLLSTWIFGFIGTFIALDLHPVPAIITLTLLAGGLFYLNGLH